jgi:hypothetical protein
MVMDYEPDSMRIQIIDDVLMKQFNALISEEKIDIEGIINIIEEVYKNNHKIYEGDSDRGDRYVMNLTGVNYIDLDRYPTIKWGRKEIQFGKYYDQYTRETEIIEINLNEIKVPYLEKFEDNVQMQLMFHNNGHVHLVVFTLPITDCVPDEQIATNNCNNKYCYGECKCFCHEFGSWIWCNSCLNETQKIEFLHKMKFGTSKFVLYKENFVNIIRKSKKLNIKLYDNVYKLERTFNDYCHYFKTTLHKKIKSLEYEYQLAKYFLNSYEGSDKKPSTHSLNNPLDAYDYFYNVNVTK